MSCPTTLSGLSAETAMHGGNIWRQFTNTLISFKPPISVSRRLQFLPSLNRKPLIPSIISLSESAMDAHTHAHAQPHSCPEIQELSPMLQKLNENGTPNPIPDSLSLLRIKKLSPNATLPSRAFPLSAGYDLSSAAAVTVPARGKALVPTDLRIGIPQGTYARIAPRSGLAWKHSIDVGAGVIDADYRGPVGVILFNHSDQDFEVKAGDRVAQLILEKIVMPQVVEVDDLDSTERGDGGFGSTGV